VKLKEAVTENDIATLPGNGQPVTSVAFSPDGRTLAVASGFYDVSDLPGHVILWDVASRKRVRELKGYKGAVMDVSFSPDGRMLVTACNDRTVILWDAVSWKQLHTWQCEEGYWCIAAFSPDSRMVATSATLNGTRVDLWDAASGESMGVIENCRNPRDLAFSPDGKMLAISVQTGVRLVELATRQDRKFLPAIPINSNSLAFTPDSKNLAVGCGDNTIQIWNLNVMEEVAAFHGQHFGIKSVVFSPDNNLLVTGGLDGTLQFWRAASLVEADGKGNGR
jgi:WD40 repeat protein